MVFAPSLIEVEDCGLLPLVRGGVWFVSLKCEVDWLLAYPSVVRWLFERGVRYSKL